MNNTPTPRTDKAAYGMGRSGEHRDIERWCDLLNESRKLEEELTAAREQRDKLAQALENCREDSIELLGERDWWQLENRGDYQQRYQTTRDNVTHADAALQSLTPTEP